MVSDLASVRSVVAAPAELEAAPRFSASGARGCAQGEADDAGIGDVTSMLKGLGYLVSTLSVALLGIVAWKSASEDRLLLACLIGGMTTSITGMTLRWLSHRQDQKEKDALRRRPGG